MENKKDKRLVIDMKKEMHTDIKAMAAYKNISIKRYVVRILRKALKQDMGYIKK